MVSSRIIRFILLFSGLFVIVCSWILWPNPEQGKGVAGKYPNEYEWVKRTWPHFTMDPAVIQEMAEQTQSLRHSRKTGTNGFGEWENVGPTNISGRISDVAFDPLHPDTIWAGSSTGGVLKSVDGGTNWAFVSDAMPTLQIGDIAVDPVNPEIVYAGTGEGNGGHNNFPGLGVFKSSDGGSTWTSMGLDQTSNIGRIIVDPMNPNRVWVAAIGSYFDAGPHRGLYRSMDAGASWEKVLFVNDSTGVIDLVMDPTNTDVLYAASWHRVRRVTGAELSGIGSAIYKSEDGGTSWTKLVGGLPISDFTEELIGRIGLAICPANPEVVYALFNRASTHLGLYRTQDGGGSWERLDSQSGLVATTRDFTWYFGNVRVYPTDCNRIYVMDVLLSTSSDGGDYMDGSCGDACGSSCAGVPSAHGQHRRQWQ